MIKPDATYSMIKSLSKREKDLFVRYANLEGQGSKSRKYVDLFRAFNDQAVYNEKAIIEQFKGEGFVKNFSEAKRSLRETILKMLLLVRENPEKDISFLVLQADLLLEKGLFEEAEKIIRKGKAAAESEERFSLEIRLIDLEIRLLISQEDSADLNKKIAGLNAIKREARKKEIQLHAFQDLYNSVYPLFKANNMLRGGFATATMQDLAKNPLLKTSLKSISNRAAFYLHRLHFLVDLFQGNLSKGSQRVDTILDLFESFKILKSDFPEEHIRHLGLATTYAFNRMDFKSGKQSLAKLGALKFESNFIEVQKLDWYYINHLVLALNSGQTQAAIQLLPEITQFLEKNEDQLNTSRKYLFNFSVGKLLMQIKDLKGAAKYFQRIIDQPNKFVRTDIQSNARILLLLIYFERGEESLVDSLTRSTVRYLQSRQQLFKFERRMLTFISKNVLSAGYSDFSKSLQKLKDDLTKIMESPDERRVLNYFNFIEWIDQKLSEK